MGSETRYRIRFPSRLPRFLLAGVVVLLVAHITTQALYIRGYGDPYELHLFFNVDDEPSIPTWYSASMMIIASGLLLAIAGAKRRERDRDARYWYALSVGFALMSLDEIAGFHETLNTVIDTPWTIPAAFFLVFLGMLSFKFLTRLPARSRNRFLAAAAIYLSGAVVVEHLSGPPYIHVSLDSIEYAWLTMVEEGLEKTGVALFIGALLDYLRREAGGADDPEVGIEP